MARYTTDEVMAMMQSPQPEVEVLERPASPFLDPAQINAAERELSQPAPEVPRPDSINAPGANLLLQNYTAEEAFPVDSTPAPQRPADGNATLYPSRNETSPNLPKPRYSTDEVISLYANESKPRLSTKQVMVEMIKPLYDPTLPRPSKEEFFKLRDIEKQLRDSGDIPSNFEETANAVGGFFVTAVDALNTALWKVDREQGLFEFGGMGVNPALAVSETWRRLPGTIAYGAEMTKQGYAAMGAGLQAMGGPKYRVKETGEFVMDEEGSAGGQFGQIDPRTAVDRYKANGLTLAPVNAEDLRDFEYQQWGQGMDRSMEVEKARTAAYPEETVYKILSNAPAGVSDTAFGTDYLRALENRPAPPMESQAVGASILADPATYISLGAGAAKIGLSAAMKGATARSLNVIGKATQRFVNPAEVPLRAMDRFRKVVVSPAKVAGAYGAASGVAWAADQFELPSELKTAAFTAASLYTAYKGGLGVLRFAGKNLPEAAVILRESADATSGLDRAARQAVAANPNVPANISERLLRPSQFVSMESTPARLAQNQQLSPGTRKLMDKLSNFYVVQGVRGASAVATGSVKGGLAMVPFAETMRMSGDDRAADTMYGMGLALGALGGAGERVLGARGRRVAQAESDIGRMLTDIQAGNVQPGVKRYQWIDREVGRLLTDVELAAGDVSALVQNRSFDELARTAAMQGFFRNVDYIPLNAADFELNAKEHGGSGSAGYFIRANAGERPQIFVNVEARRADVEPHEYFEAFFSSDAFSPEQRAAMRAQVDQRYGADGLMARGREYAEALIKAENSKNFPNETLFVSNEQIQLKMDELAQDELGRGGQDPMDWVRREVMVEEARMAGIDFAAIRRNVPAGENPITFMENVLGASARALGLSGVRIDPETGMAITPEQLFRENPVAANDPKLVKHLNDYVKAYRQWMNDPTHEVPQGVRIARDGRPESLADNPNVSFYSPKPEDPTVPRENALAIIGPDGRVIEKSPKQRRTERKARSSQVKNMAGRNLLAPGDPTFGLKRWADGRIRASGRRLPQTMALQVHWKPWLPIINAIEGLADANESMQVRYFAKGNSADKVKTSRVSDIDAINREVVFDQWTTNAAGDLLAQLLDMTTLRNRAMRAISERHPSLDPANGGPGYSLQAIMDDVTQWMSDKRAGKDGAATIGNDRKNIVNALINPGTAVNRGKNPLAGTFGKGSAVKTLLLENINAVSGTGRKGAAMDYNWANGNFMPDKPAPRPDMDSDVPAPRGMVNRQPARAQMMPDYSERADIPLNERARRAAFVGADGRVVSTNKRTHFETNEDLGPDFLAIGAGSISEDGFFRFGSQTMDDAMGESPRESLSAAARHNQALYRSGQRPSALLEDPPGLEPAGGPTDQQTMVQRDPSGQYEPLGMLRKGANGKWQVFTSPMMSVDKDGRQVVLPPTKVAEYATEAQARTRAEKEFFTGLPLQDAKQYLPARERQAITDAQKRIAEVAKNSPEAARLEVTRDDRGLPKVGLIEDSDGNPVLDARGNQMFGAIYKGEKYGLREAPGLSKDEARAVQQAADLMEADARRGQQNPAIAKGIGWYGRMRSWLQNAYGATIERFGQLLGATSARTPVDMNFIQAREALQMFGRGAYDDLLKRFDAFVMQKKADADSGKMEADWRKKGGKGAFKLEDEYRKQVNSFKEVPLRANGKKYNANSTKVLHALYGNWIAQTKGPKTPNFAGNLTGRTFKATIDVWAARNLRRLLYQGKKARWRILPEQEQGVTDADFFFSQKVYDEVGRRMGVPTDDLQALQWFNEKDVWEVNGWTDKTGAEKSSFDKEAGKLNVDRYQVGLTTFTTPEQFNPAVQRSEMATFRESVRGLDGLEAARITESEGLYGDVVEPSFDVEFSVNRRGDVSPSIEPVMRSAIETAQRNNQKDVIISLVVDELHPNARPMVEVGFKSAATKAQVDAVTAAFRANGIDGFTIARNERGDALGVRSQYVPEISARYDTLDHLNPDQFAINSGQWVDKARRAIANLENQDNVSYRKEGYVSTAVYGIEEYTTATPADLRGSNAKQELGRRRAILAAGTR